MEHALIPCEDKVVLCEFNGFDEGEGVSMGSIVKWKNPKNTKEIDIVSTLSKYDKNPVSIAKKVFTKYGNIDKLFLHGALNHTGWYYRDEIFS